MTMTEEKHTIQGTTLRPLRIAILSGGRFTHVPPYLKFLTARGHDVHWITFTMPGDPHGATVHDVSGGTKPSGPTWLKWRYLLSTPKIRRTLRELRPDLLHAFYATSAGVLSVLSGFRPYILSVRGSDLIGSMQSRIWKPIVRMALRKAELVHTVSQQLADFVSELGIPTDKSWMMTQGVDTSLFCYRPKKAICRPVRILCTRTLRDVYDPFTSVRACKVLKDRGIDFKLTFAAGGTLEQSVRRLVSELDMSGRVEFLGGYDNATLPGILSSHDLFLSANRWDGTSISVLEAMSSGIFPVVTRITSTLSWLEDGRTALMFEPGNAGELADALIKAMDDDDLRMVAVEKNRQVVEERADRERNMLALEQQYYELIG